MMVWGLKVETWELLNGGMVDEKTITLCDYAPTHY